MSALFGHIQTQSNINNNTLFRQGKLEVTIGANSFLVTVVEFSIKKISFFHHVLIIRCLKV